MSGRSVAILVTADSSRNENAMTQQHTEVDFEILGTKDWADGTASIVAVIHVLDGYEHRMRLCAENVTGAFWFTLDPIIPEHRGLQVGDIVRARFSYAFADPDEIARVTGLRAVSHNLA